MVSRRSASPPTQANDRGVEYALLGLLRERPMHAYEMHQQLERSDVLGRVWRLKQSHLYALLARLETEGYIAATTEQQGSRPPRRMLRLTRQGEARFSRWATQPVEHGRDFRLDFLAKLFFAAQDGPEAVAALVGTQSVACASWLEAIRAQADAFDSGDRRFDLLVLRFRSSQLEAILGWLDECEAEFARPSSSQ
jgi:PadR family transcriptional regulator AphA